MSKASPRWEVGWKTSLCIAICAWRMFVCIHYTLPKLKQPFINWKWSSPSRKVQETQLQIDSKVVERTGCKRESERTAWLISVRERMQEFYSDINSSSTCSSIGGNTNICLDGAHNLGKVNTSMYCCSLLHERTGHVYS